MIVAEFEENIETFFIRLVSCWKVLEKLKSRDLDLAIKYNCPRNKWIITIYNVS